MDCLCHPPEYLPLVFRRPYGPAERVVFHRTSRDRCCSTYVCVRQSSSGRRAVFTTVHTDPPIRTSLCLRSVLQQCCVHVYCITRVALSAIRGPSHHAQHKEFTLKSRQPTDDLTLLSLADSSLMSTSCLSDEVRTRRRQCSSRDCWRF